MFIERVSSACRCSFVATKLWAVIPTPSYARHPVGSPRVIVTPLMPTGESFVLIGLTIIDVHVDWTASFCIDPASRPASTV